MATKKTQSDSPKCSEKVGEKYCSACLQTDRTVEAEKYCVGCASLLCEQCLQHHDKFPSLRSHQIIDKFEANSVRGDNSIECARHYGHLVNSNCKDHDVVCCEACLTMYHRSCRNVNQITDIANETSESAELMAAKQNLESYLKLVQQEINDRNKNVTNLDKNKDAILIEIGKSEDEMIKRIKNIAEKSREEVSAKHAEHVKAVMSDVKALETVTSVMQKGRDKLKKTDLGDLEMFVHIKNCESIVTDVRNVVRTLYENWQQTELSYQLNQTLCDGIMNAKSYGDVVEEIVDDTEYIAKYNRDINIKLEDDTKVREIMGICVLENDTIVVTDFYNKRLKRLNKDGGMVDYIDLGGSPASLCQIGPEEVAAALRDEKRVQFVSVGQTLSLAHSFETKQKCTGLGYDSCSEELYVSCDNGLQSPAVNVYNRKGDFQRTYDKGETEDNFFKSPHQILLQLSSDKFYVADAAYGVIALSKKGEKLWNFTGKNLVNAWGIVNLPKEKLLVSGVDSNNVLQLGTNGKGLNELLGASEGLELPSVLFFNRQNSTLLVGGQSDSIKEYIVSRKPLVL